MVVVNHQIKRAMPLRQFNKELREEGSQTGVLTFLRHRFAGSAVSAGGLLDSGD